MAHVEQAFPNEMEQVERTAKILSSGSLAEGLAGGAAVALSIIGLAGIYPTMLMAIAATAIGASLLFEGGAVAARYSALLSEVSHGKFQTSEMGVGITSEFLGGVAGATLGILAILGIAPMVLVPVAILTFGATFIFSSGITSRLNALEIAQRPENPEFGEIVREAVNAAAVVQVMIGMVAIVLGILALIHVAPVALSLVGTLLVGAAGFIDGTAISAKMVSLFQTS